MKLPGNLAYAVVFALLLFSPQMFSHTTVTNTIPGNGSVLAASPEQIELQFAHAARLTSVVLIEADKRERRLAFSPDSSAEAFQINVPGLAPGRNEIHWKALSSDGHVIDGSIIYTIKPDDAKTD